MISRNYISDPQKFDHFSSLSDYINITETFTNFLLTSSTSFHFSVLRFEKVNANSSPPLSRKEEKRKKQKIFNKAAYNYNPGKRRP